MTITSESSPAGTTNQDPVQTTVIVPAYNEEQGLPVVLSKLFVVIDRQTTEVLVVDDGSTDATCAVALDFPCRVVRHEVNRGKAEAMRTGIEAAFGENVVFIDADDTYPAELVPELIELLRDADFVVASRATGQGNIPAFNRIGNWIFRASIRRFYGFKPIDPLTGFFAAKKRHLIEMDLRTQNFQIESEIAIKGAARGLAMLDRPIEYGARIGEAKLRGLQDGYTIFETIVRMLPVYSPVWSLLVPGLAATSLGLLLGLTAGDDAGIGLNAFSVALAAILLGLQAAALGLLLLGRGVAQCRLHRGRAAALLASKPATRVEAFVGLALIAAGLLSASNGSLDDAAAASLALGGGVAGLLLLVTTASLTLWEWRPGTPTQALPRNAGVRREESRVP